MGFNLAFKGLKAVRNLCVPSWTRHLCHTAIKTTATWAIRSATDSRQQGTSGHPRIVRGPYSDSQSSLKLNTNMVKATGSMYIQNCSQFLPVVFTDFTNYYSVGVSISTRQSSILYDREKCIFSYGIRHIFLRRSILRY